MSAATGVTVVVPCHNEEDNVQAAYRAVVTELADYDLDLLFVDDGSTDSTLAQIRDLAAADPRVRYLSFTRNFGFEAAFSAGFRYASQPWVLQLDADLQFPPAEARKLLARAVEGYDAVYGVREQRNDPLVRRWASLLYHTVARRLLGIPIPPKATTFRVLRASVARRIVELQPATRYFMATVPLITSRYTTVPVAHRARERGRSKFRLSGLASHALDLYFGYSTRLAGLLVGGAALAAVLAAVAALLSVVGVFGGVGLARTTLIGDVVLLLAISALARYVVMAFAAAQRPGLYYVRESNFPVAATDILDDPPSDVERHPAPAAPARVLPLRRDASTR